MAWIHWVPFASIYVADWGKKRHLFQGAIDTPNSVPMVFIVFPRDSWGLYPITIPTKYRAYLTHGISHDGGPRWDRGTGHPAYQLLYTLGHLPSPKRVRSDSGHTTWKGSMVQLPWLLVYHSPLTKIAPPFGGCAWLACAIYFSDGISALTLMFLSRNPEASSLSTLNLQQTEGNQPTVCWINSGDSSHHGGVSATGICLV